MSRLDSSGTLHHSSLAVYFHKTGLLRRQTPTFSVSVMVSGYQARVEASQMEPVGAAFVPQVAVADQHDRGDMWSKGWSRGSLGPEISFPLVFQVNLTRHVYPSKSRLQIPPGSQLLCKLKTFTLRTRSKCWAREDGDQVQAVQQIHGSQSLYFSISSTILNKSLDGPSLPTVLQTLRVSSDMTELICLLNSSISRYDLLEL